jgi:hypothetical protein
MDVEMNGNVHARKVPHEGPKRRLENNIKMDLTDIGHKKTKWIKTCLRTYTTGWLL